MTKCCGAIVAFRVQSFSAADGRRAVADIVSLKEAVAAHQALEARKTTGSTVLLP